MEENTAYLTRKCKPICEDTQTYCDIFQTTFCYFNAIFACRFNLKTRFIPPCKTMLMSSYCYFSDWAAV